LALKVRERGIALREGAQVSQLKRNATGIEIETAAGSVHARVLIGADGVSGIVRRWLGLGASLHRAQVIELDTERVAADLPRDTLHFDYFDPAFTGYAWDFPTLVEGVALMCRGVYHLRAPGQSPHDIQGILAKRLSERGLDIARYRIKRFAECGFEPHRSYAAQRVALVGEAAGIDAFSGEGIAQAIEYGAFAGRYLAEKLAASDLSFSDWNKRLAQAPVGFDLHMREWWLRKYFGPMRGMIERHLINQPSFVQSIGEQLSGSNSAYWHLLQAFGAAGMKTVSDTLKQWTERRQ
jgi:flavin-dependent dehydrogenase